MDPVFSTALSQPLLWYRLFPSATNPLGIIPQLILAVGPLLVLIGWAIFRNGLRWDGFQLVSIAGVLAGFSTIGLIASVKIGGGNNLHNLDMLLIGLVLLAWITLTKAAQPLLPRLSKAPISVQAMLVLTLLVPAAAALRSGEPLRLAAPDAAEAALQSIRSNVVKATQRGEVLFIDQRQLFTFGHLEGIPLVMEYELKDMMNQAMGSNEAYFERFRQDLRTGRFPLIIVDPQKILYQGKTHAFGEENDAWVRQVSVPLLEYYEPAVELKAVGVWLMSPISP